MKHFENELEAFLQANRLPPIDAARSDGWVYFLYFYANVISDWPARRLTFDPNSVPGEYHTDHV
jgi:hypothetical protein